MHHMADGAQDVARKVGALNERNIVDHAAFAAEYQVNVERFWSKVDRPSPQSCWEWSGALNKGYGQFHVGRSSSSVMLAHRIAYGLANGKLPEAVCHSCDNPRCCNPAHLFGGTRADNNLDMTRKGRHAKVKNAIRGEKHPQAKLTDTEVAAIREKYARGGATQRQLAARHGVCQRTIAKAVLGISFKNVARQWVMN
ncbi:hypothetical protein GCM10011345_32720 [Gemmobacter megaterium]|nr:hypothetical protein GCM10011345_32720 [Gemmobacter megaterium]